MIEIFRLDVFLIPAIETVFAYLTYPRSTHVHQVLILQHITTATLTTEIESNENFSDKSGKI